MNHYRFLLLVSIILVACRQNDTTLETTADTSPQSLATQEAREDSLELANAYAAQEKIPLAIPVTAQTEVIKAETSEDAADDPAIWVHPTDPEQSLIYGSNKRGGLAVYNLSGQEVAYYPIGNINNVDILDDFDLAGQEISILGCSNRTTQGIDLFSIDPADGTLIDITAQPFLMDSSLIDDIYGFCFAKTETTSYVFINGKNGRLQQYEMRSTDGKIHLEMVRQMTFASQTEGMVADNLYGTVFVGEEDRGVWKINTNPTDTTRQFIADSGPDNPNIRPDVEGITLWENGDDGYLIVSSQGNFSYALFERKPPHTYLTSFKLVSKGNLDGAEETDGLDVVEIPLSKQYPAGLLVVQDGFNYEGDNARPQNFKLVSWADVLALMPE